MKQGATMLTDDLLLDAAVEGRSHAHLAVLADLVEERGDQEAVGWRRIVEEKRWPVVSKVKGLPMWCDLAVYELSAVHKDDADNLPERVFALLCGDTGEPMAGSRYFASVAAALRAAAAAYTSVQNT